MLEIAVRASDIAIDSHIDVEVEHFIDDFCNEVIDQQIRLDLDVRTYDIKKIIYEKAFSALKVKK